MQPAGACMLPPFLQVMSSHQWLLNFHPFFCYINRLLESPSGTPFNSIKPVSVSDRATNLQITTAIAARLYDITVWPGMLSELCIEAVSLLGYVFIHRPPFAQYLIFSMLCSKWLVSFTHSCWWAGNKMHDIANLFYLSQYADNFPQPLNGILCNSIPMHSELCYSLRHMCICWLNSMLLRVLLGLG